MAGRYPAPRKENFLKKVFFDLSKTIVLPKTPFSAEEVEDGGNGGWYA